MYRTTYSGRARSPLWLAVALACAGAARAETQLKEVVVSATHSEQETRAAPASVSIVTREEIATRNPTDLLDTLRGTPGITLMGRGVGGRKTIALRGLAGKHVLTLIDGRRITPTDDVVGHSDYQYGWLPMSAIERVEVVRGPMSTLYGSEALGGVVNLITRQPKDRWIGSIGLTGADLRSGDGGDRAGASLFAAGPVSESFDLRLTAETNRLGAVPDKDHPRFSELEGRKNDIVGAMGRLKLAPGHTLEASWTDGQEKRWRDDISRGQFYKDHYDIERHHGYLTWRGEFDGWRAQANAYRSEFDVKNTRTNGVEPTPPQNFRDVVYDAHATTRLGSHRLTFGGEYRTETMRHPQLTTGKDDASHKALFIQDELPLAKHLALTAGLRADHHEFFGTEWSPRAYLVWEATPELIIKGGYGHAFKAPTLKQISPVYVGTSGPHSFYGNPNLKPEKSDSIEIGADWQRDLLGLRATLFHTELKDLITTSLFKTDPAPPFPPRRYYRYVNLNKARVSGLETGFTWSISPELLWQTDLTLLRTRDKVKGKELYERPKISAASRLDWKGSGGWSGRIGVEYVGRQLTAATTTTDVRLPAYSLWNVSIAKQFGKQLTARVGIDNLTDVRLAEKDPNFGYAERGRTLFLNLRVDF
ncbi:MAG: TonB-dependent receptor [Tepidimonas sp.]|uniref:TonB-dependent receptor plug domain-containing protein n=1 Tax=Tepidimonas sp. TaxID=2002775 RepID=UPI00259DFA4D|nr:TonB-dependent receptor [Tepidimonas sp.]MDM7457008.1 TonB-dependent receptor [Tepidimonas sp.]